MGQTTITLSDDQKDALAETKPDNMSWGDYLTALREESDQLKTDTSERDGEAFADRLDGVEDAVQEATTTIQSVERSVDELLEGRR